MPNTAIDTTTTPEGTKTACRAHHKIRSMAVSGGFLDGAQLDFADGLNCIIGGRGTGKTTVLEFIRYLLGPMPETPEGKLRGKAIEGLVRRNLGPGTISLDVETKHGSRYRAKRPWDDASQVLEANGGAGLALINTFVAAAAAILAWNVIEKVTRAKSSMLGAASGMIAGLVAITPACGSVGPIGAIVLGALASAGCYFFVAVVKNKFGYDDSLDVFGIHGIGGIIGAIGTGIFTAPGLGGIGGDDYSLVGQTFIQFQAVVITIVWCGVISFILFKIVDMLMGLRIEEDLERQGLDTTTHGESAYGI